MLETISPGHYRLLGQLTVQDSAGVLDELLALVHDKQLSINQMDLDVSGLEAADSVLLAAIIQVARTIESRNGILRVHGLPDTLGSLAHVYGVDTLIDRYRLRS